MKAKIAEIFQSWQGEGLYQGLPQIFVRFFGCNFNCCFCDTPLTSFEEFSVSELVKEIQRFSDFYHSVSLTGGEPLQQAPFLRRFLRKIKILGYKTFLETNGILYKEMQSIIDNVDIISMDFKLPSSTRCHSCWQEHRNFLEVIRRKEVYVKAIICLDTSEEDLIRTIDIIEEVNREIPLVLQPNFYDLDSGILSKISRYQEIAKMRLPNVRMGLQLHKMYQLLPPG